MPDETGDRDESLEEHIDELLSSAKAHLDDAPKQAAQRPTTDEVPSSNEPGLHDSLAASVGELLESVSETVEDLEPAPARARVVPLGAAVVLAQPELSNARAFYEGVLGLEPLGEPEGHTVRYALGSDTLLELGPGETQPSGAVALRIWVDDVDRTRARLEAIGVTLGSPSDDDATATVRDPAGHVIALTTRPTPSPQDD